jgi:hypothetical protein
VSTLGIAGKGGWSRMAATLEERAGQARRFVLDTPGNRFATDRAHRDRQLLAAVRNRFPEIVEELGEAAILALTREIQGGACSWCAAAQIAGHDLEATPARLAALGSMCSDCRRRRDAAESAGSESAHLRELSEAGLSLAAAGRLRTPQAIRKQAEGIRRLREAPPPMAPTGMLWTGSKQPAEVSRALTAALAATDRRPVPSPPSSIRQRVADPPWYQRRPVPWPPDARRVR